MPHAEPVVAPGMLHPPFDERRAGGCHVVEIDDAYRMVYWGTDGEGRHTILQAGAANDEPDRWRPLGTPLIGPQSQSKYNCAGPSFPFLLPVTDRDWLLYFCGWGRSRNGKLPNTTGVAISEDAGCTWRYHTEHPIVAPDRLYDAEGSGSVWVMLEGDLFRMYYTSLGHYTARPDGAETGHGDTIPQIGIGYAESRDGLSWEKPVDHLVVAPRGFGVEPFEYICSKPCVVRLHDHYVMWVNTYGTAYRVHRLVSRDGISWDWAQRIGPDGELGIGAAGAFDDRQRSYPSVVRRGDQWRCWFTGNDFGVTGMGYSEGSGAG